MKGYERNVINRVGETRLNSNGSLMIVEEYIHCKNILVRFIETGNIVRTNWWQFCKGNVKNVYDKTIFGLGYVGEGKYNDTTSKQYKRWHIMIQRCYDKNFHSRHPTYKDCTVCEEWLNFQNFAAWYDKNYYEIDGEKTHLDKDILIKDNKVYSPDTCVFVPRSINGLFVNRKAKRGNLPIGVSWSKTDEMYIASCENFDKTTLRIGRYDTPQGAFFAYKKVKEEIIKRVAEKYKDKIPEKLYEAMLNYKIEITD